MNRPINIPELYFIYKNILLVSLNFHIITTKYIWFKFGPLTKNIEKQVGNSLLLTGWYLNYGWMALQNLMRLSKELAFCVLIIF